MTIDSHVHFWNYDKVRDAWITTDIKRLQRDYLPGVLVSVLKENEVEGVIAIKADQHCRR